MLSATAKTQRLLETIQLVLTFASVCAVVETSRIDSQPYSRPGYYTTVPQDHEASGDRRFADLARADRKRREAEQQSSRRGLELGQVLQQRQVRA